MASTIKQRLRRYNGTDYDTVHLETDSDMLLYNGEAVTSTIDTLNGRNVASSNISDEIPTMSADYWYSFAIANYAYRACGTLIISLGQFFNYTNGGAKTILCTYLTGAGYSGSYCSFEKVGSAWAAEGNTMIAIRMVVTYATAPRRIRIDVKYGSDLSNAWYCGLLNVSGLAGSLRVDWKRSVAHVPTGMQSGETLLGSSDI